MAGKVLNIKVSSPLKHRSGLTGKCHAICHYSYNLPLGRIVRPFLLLSGFLLWPVAKWDFILTNNKGMKRAYARPSLTALAYSLQRFCIRENYKTGL
jgi:hypothetical protein